MRPLMVNHPCAQFALPASWAAPPPDGVDADKIDATFKDGVLTVSLPKTPEAQKKEKQVATKKG